MPPGEFSLVTSTCSVAAVPLVAGLVWSRPATRSVSCWRELAIGYHAFGGDAVQNGWGVGAGGPGLVRPRPAPRSCSCWRELAIGYHAFGGNAVQNGCGFVAASPVVKSRMS